MEGGVGLAGVEGIPLLIPRSAPGDVLRVRITERHRDYGRAEIEEVISPGPDRVQAPCPIYEECGGCDLQHIRQDRQLRIKADAALETLRRIGGIEIGEHRLVAGKGFDYRTRAQLQVRGEGNELDIGFFARGSNSLVATLECPIMLPGLEKRLPDLLRELRAADSPPRRVDLLAGDGNELSTAPPVGTLPHGHVERRIGDFLYRLDARCFFQAHEELVSDLVEVAVGDLEGEAAVELHSGVGLFTLPLARRYGRVFAAESDRIAVRYLRRNARENRVSNLELSATSAEHALRHWQDEPDNELFHRADRWLVDPPRTGLSRNLVAALLRARPERVTYVSCQAPTLARDLSRLDWLYEVEESTFLDLFPQTAHLETVVQLRRRAEPKERPAPERPTGARRQGGPRRGRDGREGGKEWKGGPKKRSPTGPGKPGRGRGRGPGPDRDRPSGAGRGRREGAPELGGGWAGGSGSTPPKGARRDPDGRGRRRSDRPPGKPGRDDRDREKE